MLCIAAFIILTIIVSLVPIIRIFNKKVADSIWKLFKKALYCVSRRATFRKCDSSFKDDIKNTILRKVVLKRPKMIKPLSIIIEITATLIIVISLWSVLIGVKSLLSLYVYGTCDISRPASCSLSGESCGIDSAPINFRQNPIKWTRNWFTQFGNIIVNIPTRMRTWDANKFIPENSLPYNEFRWRTTALKISDPGCIACQNSFRNKLEAGFFEEHNVALMLYPIKYPDGEFVFANSYLITSYIEAARLNRLENSERPIEWLMIERLFTGKDDNGREFQALFNVSFNEQEAREVLESWLKDFGYSESEIREIAELADSDKVREIIERNRDIVNNEIRTKQIPTTIYNGRRREGLFER